MTDRADIAFHTLPTIVAGGLCGFMAGFGLNSPTLLEASLWLAPALAFAIAFSVLWYRREQRQHDGRLGGTQSWLEAYVPFTAGLVSFALFTAVFYYLAI